MFTSRSILPRYQHRTLHLALLQYRLSQPASTQPVGTARGQATQPRGPLSRPDAAPATPHGLETALSPQALAFSVPPAAQGRATGQPAPQSCPLSPCHLGLPAYHSYTQLGPGLSGGVIPAPPSALLLGTELLPPRPWLTQGDSPLRKSLEAQIRGWLPSLAPRNAGPAKQ